MFPLIWSKMVNKGFFISSSVCLQGDWWQVTSANHINRIHAYINRASAHQLTLTSFQPLVVC